MADDFTQLNPGLGGDIMDETVVVYPSEPTQRKRARVVISGDDDAGELAAVMNSQPDTDDYGLVVRPIQYKKSYPGNTLISHGSVSLVPSDILTTIVSYTVPSDKQMYLSGFGATGNVDARYSLCLDNQEIRAARTSVAFLNVDSSFLSLTPLVNANQTITVQVKHGHDGVQAECDATIIGYLVNNTMNG